MILIIDNYDSFTYNIYQAICTMTPDAKGVEVVRNDRVTLSGLEEMGISHLVISPGPGRPDGAGISIEAVRAFSGRIPVLGVCLGHQTIGQVFGGEVVHAQRLMHGKPSMIRHTGRGLFEGIPTPLEAIRYHSLVLQKRSLPEELAVTASSDDGEIMGVSHRLFTVEGVQFHPESFGTVGGEVIFENFLKMEGGLRHAA
ncbi:MAG: aminodeoxychorismate/anthranilate synthase component II [bacterium]|nr:aminodeoxychorismate/anthranilate synthase component II [bacterium]MDT8395076.1 aminodeoxychorismate/anthranilate synthase component II [bacterium]